MGTLIAIDPGKSKCGLVLADAEAGLILKGRVLESAYVLSLIDSWQKVKHSPIILLGNGTTSSQWQERLQRFAEVILVEEMGTTLRARKRYWEIWPPSIWSRWLPRGLLIPPNDVDAVAALLLLEDHLEKKFLWPGPPMFRNEP